MHILVSFINHTKMFKKLFYLIFYTSFLKKILFEIKTRINVVCTFGSGLYLVSDIYVMSSYTA